MTLTRQLAAVRQSFDAVSEALALHVDETRRLRAENLSLSMQIGELRYVRRWLRWFSRLTINTTTKPLRKIT